MQQTKADKILQFKFNGFFIVYVYISNKYVNESTRDDNLFLCFSVSFLSASSVFQVPWNCEAVKRLKCFFCLVFVGSLTREDYS